MDTSETNVKMCEKAGEIQDVWVYMLGDFFADRDRDWGISHKTVEILREKNLTWLPRQDQLQKMLGWNVKKLVSELDDFLFVDDDYGKLANATLEKRNAQRKYASQFTSMEQLWLALVMKEKYGKVWNGEDWVKK
uniref:Uncharacterized protein n=1 Tax=viral metagenome TaxID=1070528 RepID=A0A6H1Z984_9ZZZZ